MDPSVHLTHTQRPSLKHATRPTRSSTKSFASDAENGNFSTSDRPRSPVSELARKQRPAHRFRVPKAERTRHCPAGIQGHHHQDVQKRARQHSAPAQPRSHAQRSNQRREQLHLNTKGSRGRHTRVLRSDGASGRQSGTDREAFGYRSKSDVQPRLRTIPGRAPHHQPAYLRDVNNTGPRSEPPFTQNGALPRREPKFSKPTSAPVSQRPRLMQRGCKREPPPTEQGRAVVLGQDPRGAMRGPKTNQSAPGGTPAKTARYKPEPTPVVVFGQPQNRRWPTSATRTPGWTTDNPNRHGRVLPPRAERKGRGTGNGQLRGNGVHRRAGSGRSSIMGSRAMFARSSAPRPLPGNST